MTRLGQCADAGAEMHNTIRTNTYKPKQKMLLK
jgi:hypothetical protein